MRRSFLLISIAATILALVAASQRTTAEVGIPAIERSLPSEAWVEVLDGEGSPLGDRAAGRVEVLAGGRNAAVEDRGAIGSGWRVVLYFDLLLSDPLAFRNATIELAERARELTTLGQVEIVLAGEEVRVALPPTSDPDALSQALSWLRLREDSIDKQAELRLAFGEETGLAGDGGEDDDLSRPGGESTQDLARLVESAVTEEASLLREHRERLLTWLTVERTIGPKALFLIGSGFDAEPSAFYRQVSADGAWKDVLAMVAEPVVRPAVGEVGQVAAVYGWLVLPFVPEVGADALLEQAEQEAETQEGEDTVDVIFQDGRVVDRTTIGFDPRKWLERRRERRETEAARVILRPEEPLVELAGASGGEVIRGKLQLSDLLSRLPARRRVLFTTDWETISGLQPLEFAVRPEATTPDEGPYLVRGRRWAAQVTPETVSEVRARRFLMGESDEGELPLFAALESDEEDGQVRLVLQIEDGLERGREEVGSDLRVTLATAGDEGEPLIDHWVRPLPEPSADEDEGSARRLEISLARAPEEMVVVMVELLESGRWGAAFASRLGSGAVLMTADDLDSLVLPAPKAIHLINPRGPLVMGPTLFETVISQDRVSRVEFFLDDDLQVVRESPPFAANLDLGPLPQPKRVEVAAFDRAGRELGRDYLVVNEGSGVFGVRIVKPRPAVSAGEPLKLSGPVDVEAEVEPRRGQGIDRLEFFWKETLVATRFAPPWRQRVVIPPEAPKGFIRVVAYLDDEASSEDVVFINSPGSSDRLQVNLMELYVVVTDRQGRPVRDLGQERFVVREEGEEQEIATFGSAESLPLTVGLAIDSSASMFVKLPDVRFAAAEFLRGLATRRDRAFVVGFGDQPALATSTSSDLSRVIGALDRLEPDGRTAIWKAIVYALVQLQGVPGKKALIVYTDGADEDPDFSFRTTLRFARKVGVPIYVILSNNEIMRTQGRGLNVRGFLQRLETLVESVGGKTFLARVGQDMEEVYRQIDEELRSQYLVGYYSRDTGGREWRNLEVDVRGTGLIARTIAGYYR